MDLTTRSDIEAPIGYVFDQLTDFAAFEKAALRRGAVVQRTDRMGGVGKGMQWLAKFDYHGKPRELKLALQDMQRPQKIAMEGEANSVTGELVIELVELARAQTRAIFKLKLKPANLTARVIVQGMKLARQRTEGRFHSRVETVMGEIEARFRKANGA